MRAYASVYSGHCARAHLAIPDSLILITLQAVSMWDVAKDDDISALRARTTTLQQTSSSSHVTESYLHLRAHHSRGAVLNLETAGGQVRNQDSDLSYTIGCLAGCAPLLDDQSHTVTATQCRKGTAIVLIYSARKLESL